MNGLFGQPDMSVMYNQNAPQFMNNNMPYMPQQRPPSDGGMIPSEMPSQTADMPQLNSSPQTIFEAPLGGQGIPTYIGNPMIDKYIHSFIGA